MSARTRQIQLDEDVPALLRQMIADVGALSLKVDVLLAHAPESNAQPPAILDGAAVRQLLADLRAQVNSALSPGSRAAPRHGHRRLSATDAHFLGALLPVLVPALHGADIFTVAEVLSAARSCPDLRCLICDAYGSIEDGTPKRLGRLFMRGDGFEVAGFRLRWIGDARGVALWKLCRL